MAKMSDKRYTVTKEYAGYKTQKYVLRFMGDWLGTYNTSKEAAGAFLRHKRDRERLLSDADKNGLKENPVDSDGLAKFVAGKDANGNKTLKIYSKYGSFSVQTNGNLPYVHSRVELGVVPNKQYWQVLDSITSYIFQHGTSRQKKILDAVVDYSLLHDPVHKKNPVASAVREARLNVKEAKAHLDVVDKSLRGKNPVTKKRKAKKKFYKQPNRERVKKPRITKAKVKKGVKRFSAFHLDSPDKKSKMIVPDFDVKKSKLLGAIQSISYTTVRGGKVQKFIHVYEHGHPDIYMDKKGNVFSRGGKTVFTKRGFVDGEAKGFSDLRPNYAVSLAVGYIDAVEFQGYGETDKETVIGFKRGKNLLCVTSNGYHFFTIPKK